MRRSRKARPRRSRGGIMGGLLLIVLLLVLVIGRPRPPVDYEHEQEHDQDEEAASSSSLARREVLDQIPQLRLGQKITRGFRHGRRGALALGHLRERDD